MRSMFNCRFALALAAAAAVELLAVHPSGGAVPLEDVAGDYMGKVSLAIFGINPEEGTMKAKVPCEVNIGQEGDDISFSLTLLLEDEAPEMYVMTGRAGNGRFWATVDAGENGLWSLAGKAWGKPGKRKLSGKGLVLHGDGYIEIKIAVKEFVLLLE